MRPVLLVCGLFGASLLVCSDAAAQTDAQKVADALRGRGTTAASDSPQCRLFTPSELEPFVGATLAAGNIAAAGTGCQWLGKGGNTSVLIQVAAARYHEPHQGAPGFKWLPDVGTKGFVESSLGGWNAGAIDGDRTVVVEVMGPKADASTAIALLKETLKRRRAQK